MRVTSRVLIALAILASLLSFIKFQHCAAIDWQQPGTNIHACYSDIPALFYERDLNRDKWPFSGQVDRTVEYPVLQAMAMWATAKVTPDNVHFYYYFSIALLIALFIATVLVVHKIAPTKSYLYAIAPTGVAAAFINWDMWAIITMLLAIYWFDKKRYDYSAIALAISCATKFFPIILLIPIFIYFLRSSQIRAFIKYAAISIGGYLFINLPFALTTPAGWWRFFDLNIHRNPDWGSLWLALEFSDVSIPHFNVVTILVVIIALSVAMLFTLNTVDNLPLASTAIFFIAIVMTLGKVYSPQYVLWLAPLVVIACIEKKVAPFFWAWQGVEIMYHFAIWLHLAGLSGDKALIPQSFYTTAIYLRIAGLALLIWALASQHRKSSNFPREFLFESGGIYP